MPADNEKWEKRNNGKNETVKPRKNQNACRKGKLPVVGNTGSEHHQTRFLKRVPQKNKKNFSKPISADGISSKGLKPGQFNREIFWTILKMDKEETHTNEPDDQRAYDGVQGLTSEK